MADNETGGKDNTAGGEQPALPPRTGRFGEDKDPNMGKDYQFKPGQSGNPAGRKKGHKLLSTQIRELMDDPRFIERLSEKVKDKMELPDEEFQGTPMKAIITTAMIEAMDPTKDFRARDSARDWLGKFGYGTKIDITSDDEKVVVAPMVVSTFTPREGAEVGDAEAQDQAS